LIGDSLCLLFISIAGFGDNELAANPLGGVFVPAPTADVAGGFDGVGAGLDWSAPSGVRVQRGRLFLAVVAFAADLGPVFTGALAVKHCCHVAVHFEVPLLPSGATAPAPDPGQVTVRSERVLA